MIKKISYQLLVFILVLTNGCAHRLTKEEILGEYRTNSESEWETYLSLTANGSAQLKHETWTAGKSNKKIEKKLSGNWEIQNGTIYVIIDKDKMAFHLEKDRKRSEFGGEGEGHALAPKNNIKNNILSSVFWKKDGSR